MQLSTERLEVTVLALRHALHTEQHRLKLFKQILQTVPLQLPTSNAAIKVLIFDAPGICRDSIDGLRRDLHSYLSPNYWIGVVDQTELRSGKWAHTYACLALPHCSDAGAYQRLSQDAEAIRQIRDFVQNGGSFLGIGGGAFFASEKSNWIGHTKWTTTLALWPGISNGPCLPGVGAHVHDFDLVDSDYDYRCYLFWEDGGEFIGGTSTSALARYNDNKSVAGIRHVFGKGNVVLWHARLEYALTEKVLRDSGMQLQLEVIRSLPINGLSTETCIARRTMSP